MTDYNGAEQFFIESWIVAKLVAQAAALNAISAGLSGRIYNALAPPGVVYPFIVLQAQSPPQVIRGVGNAEVMVDTIYTVKAIAQGTDFASLAAVARVIRTALVSDNGETTLNGDHIFTCRFERQMSMIEAAQTKQFRHLGGEFRIQAQAA